MPKDKKEKRIIAERGAMTREDSWINSLNDFVPDLELPAEQEMDAIPTQTVTTTRTSKTADRAELSNLNQLGAAEGGLYIYVDNIIATAYTQGTITFYDSTGASGAVIQMPTAGNLGISSDSIDIIATVDILLDAPIVDASGNFDAVGWIAGNALAIDDGISTPTTTTGIAWIYVDTSDGDLKVKFGDGTIKTIVTDT